MAVSTFLGQVYAHLDDVLKDPAKPLDEKILEHIDRQVTGTSRCQALISRKY